MPGKNTIVFLNPRTCGIYKDGGTRFTTDFKTGKRTTEVDNELLQHVDAYLAGQKPPGMATLAPEEVFKKRVLVPTYYDHRLNEPINNLLARKNVKGVSIGQLVDQGVIKVRGGHGSPGNDQRTGHIPYIKVSDIRGLRVNINPTNLVSESVARRMWRGASSGLEAWDVLTPNRASSNIGEFAILLPGEEQIVITKEVFIFRLLKDKLYDPFYLLWALSLKAVREQWRRIALMQTNREDCGERYREIILPQPRSRAWAFDVSRAFRDYFKAIARAKTEFLLAVSGGKYQHVANVNSAGVIAAEGEEREKESFHANGTNDPSGAPG